MILILAVLLLAGTFSTKLTGKLGVPVLLLFLALGMAVGSDGLNLIDFGATVEDKTLAGNIAYTLLFYLKNIINEVFILRLESGTVMANLLVRLSTSALQIPLTIIVTMVLAPFFLKAMEKSGIHKKLFPHRYGGAAAAH